MSGPKPLVLRKIFGAFVHGLHLISGFNVRWSYTDRLRLCEVCDIEDETKKLTSGIWKTASLAHLFFIHIGICYQVTLH